MYSPDQSNYNPNTSNQTQFSQNPQSQDSVLQKTLQVLQQLQSNLPPKSDHNTNTPEESSSNKRLRENDYYSEAPSKRQRTDDWGRDDYYHEYRPNGQQGSVGYSPPSSHEYNHRQSDYRDSLPGQEYNKHYDSSADDKGNTVYIGNLHPDISEQEVLRVFGKCGDINEIRLIRHRDSNKVKGYGFVEFKTSDGADLAVKTLNNVQLMGRGTKVEYSHMPRILPATNERAASLPTAHQPYANQGNQPYNQSQSYPAAPNANQGYLNGMPSNIPPPGISNRGVPMRGPDLSQPHSVGLNPPPIGNQPGMGQFGGMGQPMGMNIAPNIPALMQLLTANPSMLASLGLNPAQPPLQPTMGDPSFQQQQSRVAEPQRQRPENCMTVFVGNLSYDIDDDTIRSVFRSVGEIKAIRWLNDKKSGKFKGCGFIEFFDRETTIRAAQLNGTIVMNRPMRVDFATERPEGNRSRSRSRDRDSDRHRDRSRDRDWDRQRDRRYRSRSRSHSRERDRRNNRDRGRNTRPEGCNTLFIGNLTDGVTEQDIKDLFEDFGEIKEVRFLFEKGTGRFRGCGFVEFEDEQSTVEAVKMHGHTLRGRPIRVDFSEGTKRN
eukprot:TRINITY_DN1462_c0_g1_i1.p1 TRINITY_DN1462_c0_g1~~TRINITY_DN1462_c0_g1_i1.p1  ORF type:complete len:603 (+),score=107.30 TRINITY_DN1462_c0_g1_i1:80-1888(+)